MERLVHKWLTYHNFSLDAIDVKNMPHSAIRPNKFKQEGGASSPTVRVQMPVFPNFSSSDSTSTAPEIPSSSTNSDGSSSLRKWIENFMRKNNARGGLWVFSWFVLNCMLALANKAVFWGGFNFPVLLSCLHMIMSCLLSHISIKFQEENKENVDPKAVPKITMFIIIFIVNIVFGNISVWRTSLHMSQIVRSTTPTFVLITSYLLIGTKSTWSKIVVVLLVIIGVSLTVYENFEISIIDLIILLIGNIFAALKTTMTNLCLKSQKIDPLVLTKFVSFYSALGMLLVAFLNGEIVSLYQNYDKIQLWQGYGLALATSVMAFFLNITNMIANKKTSPLTISLTANLKQVLIVGYSLMFLHDISNVKLLNIIGVAVTLSGMFVYSLLSL